MKQKRTRQPITISNVLAQLISYSAWIIVVGSILILSYLSFIDHFDFSLDWRVIGVFAISTVCLAWVCWNMFYHKQYDKLMDEDIKAATKLIEDTQDKSKPRKNSNYSVHIRYQHAIDGWTDETLQMAIDKFNDDFTAKWLNYVEKTTGFPIETKKEIIVDSLTNENKVVEVKGIKDLPYKGFKHKILMWRVKTHRYPQSGYKSSMEVLSLFSFGNQVGKKRRMYADRQFYARKSFGKIVRGLLVITLGASLIPDIIDGSIWPIILKLVLAIGSIISSVLMGMYAGVRGAKIKLSAVEEVCCDLEDWSHKKPTILPYIEPAKEDTVEPTIKPAAVQVQDHIEVDKSIFNKHTQ